MTQMVTRASTFGQFWSNVGGATAVIGAFVALFFSQLSPSDADPHGPSSQFVFRWRPNKAAVAAPLREKALSEIHSELKGRVQGSRETPGPSSPAFCSDNGSGVKEKEMA